MGVKEKAILILSIIIFALVLTLFYVFKQSDTTSLKIELSKKKALIEKLKAENIALKQEEHTIIGEIDSINGVIDKEEERTTEIKYIYKDAKVNIFSLSTDSSLQLFTNNLSAADSIRW